MIALAALIVVPWVIAGTLYWWPAATTATPAPAAADAPSPPAPTTTVGPFGTLDVTTVVISPPIELIGNEWGRPGSSDNAWFFPGTAPDVAEAFLASTGLRPDQVSALMATARKEPKISGLVITPTRDLLLGLTPDVRERLYVQLAKSGLNLSQAHAFRYPDDSVDAWLGPSLISAETRRFIGPLIYRYGQHLYFADPWLAHSQIKDPEELRRLGKALLRQKTARVRLIVSTPAEIPGLVEYWGRGGRRLDIRPLLESVAGSGRDGAIDIVHLLPAMARERLYRYPLLTAEDLNRPALVNCLWTALNFFDASADDRFTDLGVAVHELQTSYYLVDNRFELGDIVAFLSEEGNMFHAAVHLAGNLVLTKNGASPLAPWVIMPVETVVDYYRLHSPNPRLLYHRRKNL